MPRPAAAVGLSIPALILALVLALPAPARLAAQDPARAMPILRTVPHVIHQMAPRGQRYRLLRWRLRLDRVSFDYDELRRREALADAMHRTRAHLLFNAGFFDGHGRPIGLAMVRGEPRSTFSPELGGGVIVVDAGRATLHAAAGFTPPASADLAIQGRPRLVADRRTVEISGEPRTADRTALCIRDRGRILDVYVARGTDDRGNGGPTLRLFARTLQRAGCEHALNLDGGSSTGAAWREGRRRVSLPPRGAMHQFLVVRPRPRG